MNGKHFVIDVDAHCYENPRGFARYLGEPWRTRIASWSGPYFVLPAKSQMADSGVGGRVNHNGVLGPVEPGSRDEVRAAMRYLGLDAVLLLPGSMLRIGELADAGLSTALCNGYADHMLESVVAPEEGIYTILVAPNQDPPAAAELIDRVGDNPGAVGVLLLTYGGGSLGLGDTYYDPIYDACVRHDLPLVFHSFDDTGGPLGRMIDEHLGFVLNAQVQLAHAVLHGLPERYPDLRLVFEEAGVFWIPEMMFRLDTVYGMRRSQAPLLKRPPSEYIKDMFFSTQPLERVPDARYLEWAFRMCDGARCLMFASDWPHSDFDSPVVIERLGFLSDAEKRAVLAGNAARAFTRVRVPAEVAAPADSRG